MANSAQQKEFIDAIGPIMVEQAKKRGYKCVSAAIAQACIESAYGQSVLSAKYHNYFGIKCGSAWTGGSVNMKTREEYKVGVVTSIRDNFRVYDSMAAGVNGYYDFLEYKRYAAVRSQKTPEQYLQAIKDAGYATSSTYVKNNMMVVSLQGLTRFDADLVQDQNPDPGTIQKAPEYTPGKQYTTQVELKVRTGPGTNFAAKGYSGLTEDGKKHDKDHDGAIDVGTVVSCLEVKKIGANVWIRTPSGYLAAFYNGKIFIK